jgi:hypothetical protein
MVPQTACKLIRWAGAATLVLLASTLLAPGRAEASCGDYVMIGGLHAGHHPAALGNESESPVIPHCHGPMCSDNSIPPAAPAPTIEVTVERWAIPGNPILCVLPTRDLALASPQDAPCEGYGLSILRPPR